MLLISDPALPLSLRLQRHLVRLICRRSRTGWKSIEKKDLWLSFLFLVESLCCDKSERFDTIPTWSLVTTKLTSSVAKAFEAVKDWVSIQRINQSPNGSCVSYDRFLFDGQSAFSVSSYGETATRRPVFIRSDANRIGSTSAKTDCLVSPRAKDWEIFFYSLTMTLCRVE